MAATGPLCGTSYPRASGGAPYPLTASLSWEVSWEGADGAQGRLPDGTFEATRKATAGETRAVHRRPAPRAARNAEPDAPSPARTCSGGRGVRSVVGSGDE
ncbi:hypothetical protein Srut_12560 [Streptomyces rutgersensis]|nr:hypothetical protein Srut_12560 [Streptomyces rutgersensis]